MQSVHGSSVYCRVPPAQYKPQQRVPLVMTNRLSMYALTYSRAFISFIISAWKMSAEPAYPVGNLRYAYLPHGKNNGEYFDRSWVKSSGVLTHVQVQSHCIGEAF